MVRRLGVCVAGMLALCLITGCAQTLPKKPATSALYRDLQRMVGLNSLAGWEIDRLEYSEVMAAALMSVCRAPVATRQALLGWLDARIAALGGPVAEAYEKRGRKLGAVARLLEVSRVRGLLKATMAAASEDCPFWVRPKQSFRGYQLTDNRWLLSLGGGGKGIGVLRNGKPKLSGGGAGRILLGRAFGPHWTVLAGAEAGGSGELPQEQNEPVVLSADFVFPLVLRYRFVNAYTELEGGYLYRLTEGTEGSAPGAHVGISFGGRALRRRWFFPGAVFGIAVERTFPKTGDGITMIKVGFRAVLDLPF